MNQRNAAPHWIAVDWSEDGMQAWAMDNRGSALMKVRSAQGLAQVAVDAFETVLFNLVRPWLIQDRTPIVVGGLTRVLQGTSLPGKPIPCHPAELAAQPLAAADDRLALHAVPGLRQAVGDTPVILHDSLIRGMAVDMPDFNGAICIPDTQTQWVEMNSGEVTNAQVFMTAELCELLSSQQTEALQVPEPSPNSELFSGAIADALDRPDLTTQQVIPARIVEDPAKSRLKGLLIGAELAGTRALWQGNSVLVVSGSPWSRLYETALAGLGATVLTCDRDTMTLAGLKHAYQSLCEAFA